MNARFTKKLFLAFSLIAILATQTIAPPSTPAEFSADNLEIISIAPYTYGKTPPYSLGAIKSAGAYIHLKLRFRAESNEGHPNLFTTAPVNSGMRMEISGSTAAIIFPDLEVPNGLRGLTLTTALETRRWYELDVEALNGKYVRIKLDGQDVASHNGPGVSMETSQLLVGGGFDASRDFRGQIEKISIKKGNLLKASIIWPYIISVSQWVLISICGIIFITSLAHRGTIVEIGNEKATKPRASKLVDIIAVYGLSLVFIATGLLAIYLFGGQYLGLSKWLAHIMLLASLGVIVLVVKKKSREWEWIRMPLGLVFLTYSAFIVGSIAHKEYIYDPFILGILIFSLLAFSLSIPKSSLDPSLPKTGIMRLTSNVEIMIYGLLLSLSWCTLVDLTNWQAFKQAFNSNVEISIVGCFLILRVLFSVLFESPNRTKNINPDFFIRRSVKNLLSRTYLDAAIIAVFFWISFRHDSLFSLSPSGGNPEYHWEYYVGVIQTVLNGGWLLWDTPSQYGFLNILLASQVPAASAWQSFYIFQGTLLFLVSTGVYLAARRCTSTSVFHRLAVFAIVFMSLFFADPELIGPYPFPSSSVVRFFCVYALVLVVWFIPKFGLRQALALSISWTLAVLWSAESAIYGTAIFLFILAALLKTRTSDNDHLALASKYVIIAAGCLSTVLLVVFSVYFVRLGITPDLFGFFEHATGYAKGFGYVPFHLAGPGNLLFLVFMGISILCIGAMKRGGESNERFVAPLAAMAGCIWGISTYYIGRPVPQNITAMLPLITMVTYLSLTLSNQVSQRFYSLPLKAVAAPLLFLVLIPVFNPAFVAKLAHIQSFSSNIETKLTKANDQLKQLLIRADPAQNTPIVYYGDDAAPPIFSNRFAQFNNTNWLPIPLQLLEQPVTQARRSLYISRYICRTKPDKGVLVIRRNASINKRSKEFLQMINHFYNVEKVISSDAYALHHFSGIDLQLCTYE
jgi:hypothetical protein